jgi:monoamine oxidase
VTAVLQSGEKIAADRAVITVPLGLLRAGMPTLDPLPPADQQLAIGRIGYGAGVLGKIYLRFPRRFWPEQPKWFGRLPDAPDRRGTFNTWVSHHQETGLPVLLSFSNGATAARLDRSASDVEMASIAMESLRKMFGENIPEPEAVACPRWLSDPWSRGGYSYPGVGSAAEDREIHARPLGGRVFFAGEATEPVEYGTVHAAVWSAEQTAEALFQKATGQRASRDLRPWAKARTGAGRHNEG